jgi:hypothetical protein
VLGIPVRAIGADLKKGRLGQLWCSIESGENILFFSQVWLVSIPVRHLHLLSEGFIHPRLLIRCREREREREFQKQSHLLPSILPLSFPLSQT